MFLRPFFHYNKPINLPHLHEAVNKIMPQIRQNGGIMTSYVTRQTPGDTSWFTHDRFGMFIHFGLYAMPARHEWVKTNEKISEEHYDLYFKHFNPGSV